MTPCSQDVGAVIRVDSENERIPDIKSHHLTTLDRLVGAKEAWRHCEKFNTEQRQQPLSAVKLLQ